MCVSEAVADELVAGKSDSTSQTLTPRVVSQKSGVSIHVLSQEEALQISKQRTHLCAPRVEFPRFPSISRSCLHNREMTIQSRSFEQSDQYSSMRILVNVEKLPLASLFILPWADMLVQVSSVQNRS